MEIASRSYTSGQFFRPRPLIKERPESHLILIATPWGPADSAELAASAFMEQFEILEKEDLTSPFESFPTLSPVANQMRISALVANQSVYKNENLKQWRSAVEFLALHVKKNVLSWAHVGSPHLTLVDGAKAHPLAYTLDWGQQLEGQGPLFTNALGLETQVPINAGSVRFSENARLVLTSRGDFNSFWALENADFDSLFKKLVSEDAESPFWLGQVRF